MAAINPDDYTTARRVTQILGKTYICTCPDFQQKRLGHPQSPKRSLRVDGDWVGTSYGTPGDCKHLMAVKILLGVTPTFTTDEGLDIPFPNDVPDT